VPNKRQSAQFERYAPNRKRAALMEDKKKIQTYVNNFRRRISSYLKPGIGLSCTIHTAKDDGAILEFSLGSGIANTDQYQESGTTISGTLASIPQHAFGGNIEGFEFAGTNVIMEKDRIIFIKDGSQSEWSDEAAEKDVQSVLAPHKRGQKLNLVQSKGQKRILRASVRTMG
jgi:hypothetical protein